MVARIDQLAATITSYLDQNNLPHPSFDANGPITLNLSSQAECARSTAINALQELLDLLQGPIACMLPKVYNGTSLQVISRHDIARKVPMEGTISFAELAGATGLRASDVNRIMRFAMSYHRLFTEPQEGFVAHSAGSKKLATDDVVRAGVGQSFDEFYGSFARGFALAHETDMSMFDYLGTQPSKAEQFSKAMRFYSAVVPGYAESHLVEGYDWASLGTGTVVDVGGADGYVSRALSKAHPRLNLVVEDLPDVVEAAAGKQQQPMPTDCRIRYKAYNFFSPQPVASADVYLFR
ncbi:hypothetical protein PG994_007238 [Apiospora phragmitis]|uniref:O-methyltransferase C-terminal domain-containing protein n=1 Tax=Apiospora phragmitis TaxID=2905665 RepID=A0ABR1V088_9PEZI